MNIAIDFDETITRDAILWRTFIDAAIAGGHKFMLVTCRRNNMDNRETIYEWMTDHHMSGVQVYFTDLNSKLEHMRARGIKIDIWIDDDPACIIHGK